MRTKPLAPLIAAILCALSAHSICAGEIEPVNVASTHSVLDDDESLEGVTLLGALRLSSQSIDGHGILGLSGLAWDEDEQRIYAISDRGALFHFKPTFEQGRLTGLHALAAYPLIGRRGRVLEESDADAEGLDVENASNGVMGDTKLIVSFERKVRVVRFEPDGRAIEAVKIPAHFRRTGPYRGSNASLEGVMVHPTLGIVASVERPPEGVSDNTVPLFSSAGRIWQYPLREVSNSALVAIESLPDGRAVTLERSHSAFFFPLRSTFRLIPSLEATTGGVLEVKTLIELNSAVGHNIDNFEGLARHRGNRFFVISDDNANPLQDTLLLYLELDGLGS